MDEKVKSSFIPKKPIVKARRAISGDPTKSLFYSISLAVFLLCLLVSAAAYGYTLFLNNQIEGMKGELEAAVEGLRSPEIAEYKILDDRLKLAEDIVDTHHVTSTVFDLLSAHTLRSVQFTDFSFTFAPEPEGGETAPAEPAFDENGNPITAEPVGEFSTELFPDSLITVDLSGTANTFETVALQSAELRGAESLRNVELSGLTLDEVGNITFSVSAEVAPGLVSYQSLFAEQSAPEDGEEDSETAQGVLEAAVPEEDTANDVLLEGLAVIESEAVILYSDAGVYTGLCESEAVSVVLSELQTGADGTGCNVSEDGAAWAVWLVLPENNEGVVCADSTGFAGEITAPQDAITQCEQS